MDIQSELEAYRRAGVDPLFDQVMRDMARERAEAKLAPDERARRQEEQRKAIEEGFDPAVRTAKNAPGSIGDASKRILDAVAKAPSIARALELVRTLPELAAMAQKDGSVPLFQVVVEHQHWSSAAMARPGFARHYASVVQLVADSNAVPKLRLRIVAHLAGANYANDRWVHQTESKYDRRYSPSPFALGRFFARPKEIERELKGMTPESLAAAVEKLLLTGETTVLRRAAQR